MVILEQLKEGMQRNGARNSTILAYTIICSMGMGGAKILYDKVASLEQAQIQDEIFKATRSPITGDIEENRVAIKANAAQNAKQDLAINTLQAKAK